jgi:hypothetical protein
LFRCFCSSLEQVINLTVILAIALVPLAGEMVFEKLTGRNLFSFLGGATPVVRDGKIRAQGPFGHSILAGTIGAVSLPLMLALVRMKRSEGKMGFLASVAIVFASASSGPIMSALASMFALYLWRFRKRMHVVRWVAVLAYCGLSLVMTAPAYYIIARIDIVGGSTGYHRSKLIESAFAHLNEWWLGGTDYTRHWMPTGVPWSPDHTDITNHYLKMGVIGGLPLMCLFIASLWMAFKCVGRACAASDHLPHPYRFLLWSFGAMLFGHSVTFISVSYFDQSFVVLGLSMGACGSLYAAVRRELSEKRVVSQESISV